jgi:hypothetical protein
LTQYNDCIHYFTSNHVYIKIQVQTKLYYLVCSNIHAKVRCYIHEKFPKWPDFGKIASQKTDIMKISAYNSFSYDISTSILPYIYAKDSLLTIYIILSIPIQFWMILYYIFIKEVKYFRVHQNWPLGPSAHSPSWIGGVHS